MQDGITAIERLADRLRIAQIADYMLGILRTYLPAFRIANHTTHLVSGRRQPQGDLTAEESGHTGYGQLHEAVTPLRTYSRNASRQGRGRIPTICR